MKRRRWNWDYACRYREMARWLEYDYFQLNPGMRDSCMTATFMLDWQDEVWADLPFGALPTGVWRRWRDHHNEAMHHL